MKKILFASLVFVFGFTLAACGGGESLGSELLAISDLEGRIEFALKNDIVVRVSGENEIELPPMYIGEDLTTAMFLAFLDDPLDGEVLAVVSESVNEALDGTITFAIVVEIQNASVPTNTTEPTETTDVGFAEATDTEPITTADPEGLVCLCSVILK